MQQKKIILFIVIAFILSSAYLLAVGNKFNDLNFGHDWWAVNFTNPKDNNLDFSIENHGNSSDFHWTISKDKEKLAEGDIKVESGKRENIKPAVTNLAGKIVVEITTGNEKKSIYKNL